MTAAATRRRPRTFECLATALGGGALAGAACSVVGIGIPAAVVGAANGALAGRRAIYRWRSCTGPVAFVLDSTWALPTTAAALVAHAVAACQRDPQNYVVELSERCDRHVYARGLRVRKHFVLTVGNVVNGAGPDVRTSPLRRRVVVDHEHAHVWQARWFGPLFPAIYLGWSIVGGVVGAGVWLARRRRDPFGRTVDTCAYYLNPFEWWAYSREDRWPPPGMVRDLAWPRPLVRPSSPSAN